jgi:hypothetical protein
MKFAGWERKNVEKRLGKGTGKVGKGKGKKGNI